MTPIAPNPNISAMESKIGELVEMRTQAQFHLSRVNQAFQRMQLDLQTAKDEFNRLEQEIQYRMGLIQQMRGGGAPPQAQPAQWYPPGPVTFQPMMDTPHHLSSPPYQPAQPYPTYPAPFDSRMVPAQGVGSVAGFPVNPMTGRYEPYPDVQGGPDGARTESAEEIRREETRNRGY